MCGIAGFIDREHVLKDPEAVLRRMSDAVSSRGPDDHGLIMDPRTGMGLCHRRLSILDLSEAASQPISSRDQRYTLVYNGEIYNYRELGSMLESGGLSLRSTGDTEVLVESIARWGLEHALDRIRGMFALAVLDRQENTLTLVRDRLGIKPLCWGRAGSVIAFGSTTSVLRQVPGFDPAISNPAVACYLELDCVPAPLTIYRNAWKLLPGHLIRFDLDTGELRESTFHDTMVQFTDASRRRSSEDPQEHIERLDAVLPEVVRDQVVSDVPIGVLLSGGIDSSMVTAAMQSISNAPVHSFTIGFGDQAYDEADQAREIARRIGTRHHELELDASEAIDAILKLPRAWDEPFGDASAIPTWMVCRLAKEHVGVVLSGDGGDELFSGYNRHLWAPVLLGMMQWIPSSLTRMISWSLTQTPEHALDRAGRLIQGLLPSTSRHRRVGAHLHKLASLMHARDMRQLHHRLVSGWLDPGTVLVEHVPRGFDGSTLPGSDLDQPLQLAVLDLIGYLPNDILVKLDRASMSVGLEARVPLLDERMVALSAETPTSMKIRHGRGKWILRRWLQSRIGADLVDAPKQGFAAPIGDWLRGDLREWASELIEPRRLHQEGLLRPEPITALWKAHQSGRINADRRLWNVLQLQAWMQENT
ncbi:MAG: asparagine synthase (glutamine-hydrolyzing) [Phycisphaerae bacterium]|nr:asparagine synthase (glutamine-hydrolyzing) [Phycisphaerae bacterium]